ncbi:MAG: YHS domain-containing (seleno)protein [Cyclobacteriaceae bacterium]
MESRFITTQILVILAVLSYGQKNYFYQNEEGAIKGYDPVAYFKKGTPLKGKQEYAYEWKEAKWMFTSEENLKAFRKNPEKYAPQYGGYCSYAVAKGYTAKIDPTSWKIIEGKLYLSYNKSIQKNWENYLDKYINEANENWPSVLEAN